MHQVANGVFGTNKTSTSKSQTDRQTKRPFYSQFEVTVLEGKKWISEKESYLIDLTFKKSLCLENN